LCEKVYICTTLDTYTQRMISSALLRPHMRQFFLYIIESYVRKEEYILKASREVEDSTTQEESGPDPQASSTIHAVITEKIRDGKYR